VAERRRNAARLERELNGVGRRLQPVEVLARGNKIAETFWGSSWCRNLERFSDFANRLPRGRTYVRNGSVIDLQVEPGRATALVSGSEIYEVEILVTPLPKARWRRLCADCADGIDSLVELLQGRFSDGMMDVLCRPDTGMFPEPAQISLSCSCPDWATMCKHVAAVLYGIGARLDREPELLFTMRQVDHTELVSAGDGGIESATSGHAAEELAGEDLGAIFGIEFAVPESQPERLSPERKSRAGRVPAPKPKRKPAHKKSPASKVRRQKPVRDPWVTAAELRQRGVPNHVVQAWLMKGLITHSGERGTYLRGDGVEALVKGYLARTKAKRKGR
jgi:uncharacterized Zn finger protein